MTTSRRLMVTGLLCVLPMLFGDDARNPDAVNDLSLTQTGTSFRARDGPRPDAAGDILQAGLLRASLFQLNSSSQAWNADQSPLLIANGCSGFCFLHTSTMLRRAGRRSQLRSAQSSPSEVLAAIV